MAGVDLGDGSVLKRQGGVVGLLFAGIGGIVGSSWLFGPMYAAQMAGPSSIIAWFIGGLAVLILAFVYAELSVAFPRGGAMVAFPKLTHGNFTAVFMSFLTFIGFAVVPSLEVIGMLTYLSPLWHEWFPAMPYIVNPATNVLTSSFGIPAAVFLLALCILINFLSIRWVLRINTAISSYKLLIPVLTIIFLLLFSFHGKNMTAHGFATHGASGVFTALATGGVMTAFLGFRQVVALAGESTNPRRNLPIAIVGSIFICLILYVALQVAFIYAVPPEYLKHGWDALSFPGSTGPFVGLVLLTSLGWFSLLFTAIFLYPGAIFSPFGTAVIFCTSTSRIVYATGAEGLGNKVLAKTTKHGVPWVGLLVTYILGIVFFFPFPSWQQMAGYLTAAILLSYGIAPISLLALRKALPVKDYPRAYQLKGVWLISAFAFIVSNLIVYWSGVATINFITALMGAFAVFYPIYHLIRNKSLKNLDLKQGFWIFPYLGGLWLITFLGPVRVVGAGGVPLLPYYGGSAVVVIFSLIILVFAVKTALPEMTEAKNTIHTIDQPPVHVTHFAADTEL